MLLPQPVHCFLVFLVYQKRLISTFAATGGGRKAGRQEGGHLAAEDAGKEAGDAQARRANAGPGGAGAAP